MKENVKIARYQRDIAGIEALKAIGIELIRNPVASLVAGTWVISRLKPPYERPSFLQQLGDLFTKAPAEAGLIAICTAQALAPSLPYLSQAAASISKVVPLLAAG